MPTPITVTNGKITSFFFHSHNPTMVASKSNKVLTKKRVTVKCYLKKNGTVVSSHKRYSTSSINSSSVLKTKKTILKNNIGSVNDSSVAFNLQLQEKINLVRPPKAPKRVSFSLPECINDAALAHHLHIKEMKQLFHEILIDYKYI